MKFIVTLEDDSCSTVYDGVEEAARREVSQRGIEIDSPGWEEAFMEERQKLFYFVDAYLDSSIAGHQIRIEFDTEAKTATLLKVLA